MIISKIVFFYVSLFCLLFFLENKNQDTFVTSNTEGKKNYGKKFKRKRKL
jgi:hypothetical protein